MTNQIETTLQDAIEKYKNYSGYIIPINESRKLIFHNDELRYQNNTIYHIRYSQLSDKWIYEPPQKSAFQEWEESYKWEIHESEKAAMYRKEGWNGAIDAVLNMKQPPLFVLEKNAVETSDYFRERRKLIEKLKEP